MKKFICGLLIGTIISGVLGAFAVNSIYDNPYPIFINGEQKQIQGYNIDGYSYFKLRDIAEATNKFNVDFQNNNIIIDTTSEYAGEKLISNINLLDSYNNEQYHDLNVFLSNFSEALFGFESYDSNSPNYGDLLNFAYWHNNINKKDNTGLINNFGNMEMYVTEEAVDSTIDKYFGINVPHQSFGSFTYRDGLFCMPAASGEGNCYVSVAKSMSEVGDGTYVVSFGAFVYKNEYDMSAGEWNECSNEAYWSNYDTIIRSGVWSEIYTGTAIVKQKLYNGKQTYELIKYNLSY